MVSVQKAAITNDSDFENALNDALNYQNTETHPERISKIKPDNRKCNWERIEFPQGQKTGKNLNKIIRQLLLMYYLYHTVQKQ